MIALVLEPCHEEWHLSISLLHLYRSQNTVLGQRMFVFGADSYLYKTGKRPHVPRKKTHNMAILTITVFYQNNWSNWSYSDVNSGVYFMLSLFLVFICFHKTLKKEKVKCFPLAAGVVVKWPTPGKWWVFLPKILPGKRQSKYKKFWALGTMLQDKWPLYWAEQYMLQITNLQVRSAYHSLCL